jgi:hypothetical protein
MVDISIVNGIINQLITRGHHLVNGGTPKWLVYDGNSLYKWMIHPLNYIRPRVPNPPGLRGPGSRVLPRAL